MYNKKMTPYWVGRRSWGHRGSHTEDYQVSEVGLHEESSLKGKNNF